MAFCDLHRPSEVSLSLLILSLSFLYFRKEKSSHFTIGQKSYLLTQIHFLSKIFSILNIPTKYFRVISCFTSSLSYLLKLFYFVYFLILWGTATLKKTFSVTFLIAITKKKVPNKGSLKKKIEFLSGRWARLVISWILTSTDTAPLK